MSSKKSLPSTDSPRCCTRSRSRILTGRASTWTGRSRQTRRRICSSPVLLPSRTDGSWLCWQQFSAPFTSTETCCVLSSPCRATATVWVPTKPRQWSSVRIWVLNWTLFATLWWAQRTWTTAPFVISWDSVWARCLRSRSTLLTVTELHLLHSPATSLSSVRVVPLKSKRKKKKKIVFAHQNSTYLLARLGPLQLSTL